MKIEDIGLEAESEGKKLFAFFCDGFSFVVLNRSIVKRGEEKGEGWRARGNTCFFSVRDS